MASEKHIKDLIPAYVLNALDEEESLQVGKHLKDCEICQDEFRTYQEIASDLSFLAPQADPPLRLKEELLGSIRANLEPQIDRPQTLWKRLGGFRLSPALGVVVILLFIGLLISNTLLLIRVQNPQAPHPITSVRIVTLEGTDTVPRAVGYLILEENENTATLIVDDLLALRSDQQYQLWLIRDGNRDSGAVFSVTTEGDGVVQVSASQPIPNYYGSFGVTIEPVGGSPGPTGEKVLGGEL